MHALNKSISYTPLYVYAVMHIIKLHYCNFTLHLYVVFYYKHFVNTCIFHLPFKEESERRLEI